jgi:hypothetical protein
MEATVFTGWIDDHLQPHCHGAKGSASIDAAGHCGSEKEEMIALTRRRSATVCAVIFCYRNLLVRQMVQMKNKIAMLLMARPATSANCLRPIRISVRRLFPFLRERTSTLWTGEMDEQELLYCRLVVHPRGYNCCCTAER